MPKEDLEQMVVELMDTLKAQQATIQALVNQQAKEDEDTEEDKREREHIMETLRKQQHYEIQIAESENPDMNTDVFVSINGFPYLIKRGIKVPVPESVMKVLDDAVMSVYLKDENGNEIEKKVSRFSMRNYGPINVHYDQKEVAA